MLHCESEFDTLRGLGGLAYPGAVAAGHEIDASAEKCADKQREQGDDNGGQQAVDY